MPVYLWQRYVEATFDPAIECAQEPDNSQDGCPVRVTRARPGKGRAAKARRHAGKGLRVPPEKTPRG